MLIWAVITFVVAVCLVLYRFMMGGMGTIKRLQIRNADLAKIADGVHEGEYRKGRWNYRVAITTKDHSITEIKVLSKDIIPKVSQEQIARVIAKQSLEVDAVSGATVNSKALLKAIENALDSSVK